MSRHRHEFVETYDGMVAFGFSRETDEKTLMVYLQKFSDDDLLKRLLPRLSDADLTRLFDDVSRMMCEHLTDGEYHELFLKDPGHTHNPGAA